MEQALTLAILAVLVTMGLALIRAFLGPSAYNRMLAANMFGTKTVLLIVLGGQLLGWPSFVDIALLYAMVNFVVTVAVMRFFEYDESVDEPTEGAPELHPWVLAARDPQADLSASVRSGPPRDGARGGASPDRQTRRRSLRPPDDGGAPR